MVATGRCGGRAARLLPRRGRSRPPLLALPRRPAPRRRPLVPARVVRMTAYAELQVTSNFSFLRGASHPQDLMLAASLYGMRAVALTDRNTLAGVVRAHGAAKEVGIHFVVGVRLDLQDAPSLLIYPIDRAAYGRLTRLLT